MLKRVGQVDSRPGAIGGFKSELYTRGRGNRGMGAAHPARTGWLVRGG